MLPVGHGRSMECRVRPLVVPVAAAKLDCIAAPPVVPLGREVDCGYRRAIVLYAYPACGEARRSLLCWQGYNRIGRRIRRDLGLLRMLCGTTRPLVLPRWGAISSPTQKPRLPRDPTDTTQGSDSRQGVVFRIIERKPPLQRAYRIMPFAR